MAVGARCFSQEWCVYNDEDAVLIVRGKERLLLMNFQFLYLYIGTLGRIKGG